MSYRIMTKTIGYVMLLEAVLMVIMIGAALIFSESVLPFVFTLVILCALGIPASLISVKTEHFTQRCGYATVALVWFVLSLCGALPFLFSSSLPSYVDCFFETVSGFTTTGSSVIPAVEDLPKSVLLWRSTTQLIGGMGILVMITAIFPALAGRSHHLLTAEVPGPTSDKLVPKLTESSKILYSIYFALVALQIMSLVIVGIPFYDSVNLSFATLSTGGFAVTNTSFMAYDNAAAEIITAIFMLLGGVNFSLYFLALRGDFKTIRKNTELKVYILIVSAAIIGTMIATRHLISGLFQSFRYGLFSVATLITTTGFASIDYTNWPTFVKMIFIIIMLTGACAGSTAGGIKVSRVCMMFKAIGREMKQILHPNSVNIVRMDKSTVSDKTLTSVIRFFGAYFIIMLLSMLIVALDGFDFETTFSAVVACISNIGPGLASVGPVSNFAALSDLSKIVLSLDMLIGRLEIFPILIFFYPKTWKRN